MALAGEVDFFSVDEDFGEQGAGVVVRGHDEPVGPGTEDGDAVALGERGEGAVLREEVAAFADGADEVHGDWRGGGFAEGDDFVPAFVEGGADEVVHAGIDDGEGFGGGLLHILDGGEEGAGVADEEAAGLEEDFQPERPEGGEDGFRVGGGGDAAGVFLPFPPGAGAAAEGLVVDDADAAAEIEELEPELRVEAGDEGGEFLRGFGEGAGVEDLRADVGLDAADFQVGKAGGFFVDGCGAVDADAELVLAFSGGDEFVGLRVHIGVHADGDGGAQAEFAGDGVDALEFGLAFDIEGEDAFAQGVGDFLAGLPDAGEGAAAGLPAGFQHAEEFAARDDVETGAEPREEREDGEVRIRLHGIANQVVEGGEGGVEALVVPADGACGVDIGGRAEFGGDFFKVHILAVQGSIDIGKGMHRGKMGTRPPGVNRGRGYWPATLREFDSIFAAMAVLSGSSCAARRQ